MVSSPAELSLVVPRKHERVSLDFAFDVAGVLIAGEMVVYDLTSQHLAAIRTFLKYLERRNNARKERKVFMAQF